MKDIQSKLDKPDWKKETPPNLTEQKYNELIKTFLIPIGQLKAGDGYKVAFEGITKEQLPKTRDAFLFDLNTLLGRYKVTQFDYHRE